MKQLIFALMITCPFFSYATDLPTGSGDQLVGIPPFAVEPVSLEAIEVLRMVATSEVALKNLEVLRQSNYGLIGAKKQGSEMGYETLFFMFRNDSSGCTASFSLTFYPATDLLIGDDAPFGETGTPHAVATDVFYIPCKL